jgi:hypothetical protein
MITYLAAWGKIYLQSSKSDLVVYYSDGSCMLYSNCNMMFLNSIKLISTKNVWSSKTIGNTGIISRQISAAMIRISGILI